MLIYLEQQAKEYPLTKQILSRFSDANVVEIQHYKNVFDKKIDYPTEKCLILAKSDRLKLFPVPENYGYQDAKAFFFVTQLNCVFDCAYCYLKGAFKNNFPVVFVNYEDIQAELKTKILELRNGWYTGKIVFYASNYADLVGMEALSDFHQSFIPFFEQFENVLMETRTKSGNIQPLLDMDIVPKNTEIAFSLNPQVIIDEYERWASSLKSRVAAIKILQAKWWKVGLRFLPLLPVPGYVDLYDQFLRELCQEIDIKNVNSIFLATLIYNKQDWITIQKKEPEFILLKHLELGEDSLVRVSTSIRQKFDQLFKKYLGENVVWDYV